MKVFASTIALLTLAAAASAAYDASPVTTDFNSLDSAEEAYPAVLADDADERSSAVSVGLVALNLPDYCSNDDDFDCYKKGVPKCCVKHRVACPSDRRPDCDIQRGRNKNKPIIIRPKAHCNAARDECVSGYACLRGTCQRVGAHIGYDGFCRAGVDTCVSGTSCREGRCRKPVPVRIPAGRNCRKRVDRCVRGYTCRDNRCSPARTYVEPGKVCQRGVDHCGSGHTCINGRCVIGANKSCNAGQDICVSDYMCLGGTCQRERARIGYDGLCRAGVDTCVRGTSCVDGRCREPLPARIPAGRNCRKEVDRCVHGHTCIGERCSPAQTRIAPGNVCQPSVHVCENGHTCINGRCVIPPIQRGGVCRRGDTCVAGYSCHNHTCQPDGQNISGNGRNRGSGQWYTNWQYCIMDCPSTDGACCGGSAQSWDQTYGSAEACCGQSAFRHHHERCLNRSLQCAREDYGVISLS